MGLSLFTAPCDEKQLAPFFDDEKESNLKSSSATGTLGRLARETE